MIKVEITNHSPGCYTKQLMVSSEPGEREHVRIWVEGQEWWATVDLSELQKALSLFEEE